jgi:translocation and assembly module TamB
MAWRCSISAPSPSSLPPTIFGVVITYAPDTGHYLGDLTFSDLTAQNGTAAVVRSKVDLTVEAAHDAVDLKTLHLTTEKSKLDASGSLVHFANPQWKLSANGTVDLAEVAALAAVDGLKRGNVDLQVTGQGSSSSPFVLDGNAKLVNGNYADQYVVIDGMNATTRLHVTPDEITLSDVVARPRQGGVINAVFRYLNWSAPATPPSKAPSASPGTGRENARQAPRQPAQRVPVMVVPVVSIRARVHGVLLTTVLQAVVDRSYRDLGFDSAGDGTVNVDWTGTADDLTVAAVLAMSAPTTGCSRPAAGQRIVGRKVLPERRQGPDQSARSAHPGDQPQRHRLAQGVSDHSCFRYCGSPAKSQSGRVRSRVEDNRT